MDDFLKQYAVYVQGYYQTVEFIDTIDNKKWNDFLKRKRDEAKKPLVSLLILPVQRLPRYEMLLEQVFVLFCLVFLDLFGFVVWFGLVLFLWT